MIFWIIGILAILDTAIGNRLFPSTVGVVKSGNLYKVFKWQRYLFIPIKGWAEFYSEDRIMFCLMGCRTGAKEYTLEEAIRKAKIYSNQLSSEEKKAEEVVWTSRMKRAKSLTEEELTLQLGQALIDGRKEDENRIMLKLRELKYI